MKTRWLGERGLVTRQRRAFTWERSYPMTTRTCMQAGRSFPPGRSACPADAGVVSACRDRVSIAQRAGVLDRVRRTARTVRHDIQGRDVHVLADSTRVVAARRVRGNYVDSSGKIARRNRSFHARRCALSPMAPALDQEIIASTSDFFKRMGQEP
jgi:hypothetical protein